MPHIQSDHGTIIVVTGSSIRCYQVWRSTSGGSGFSCGSMRHYLSHSQDEVGFGAWCAIVLESSHLDEDCRLERLRAAHPQASFLHIHKRRSALELHICRHKTGRNASAIYHTVFVLVLVTSTRVVGCHCWCAGVPDTTELTFAVSRAHRKSYVTRTWLCVLIHARHLIALLCLTQSKSAVCISQLHPQARPE